MHNFSISIKITRLVSNFVSFTGKKENIACAYYYLEHFINHWPNLTSIC